MSNPMLGPDAWRHRTNITLAQADAACAGVVAATEKKYLAVIEAAKTVIASVEDSTTKARLAWTGIDEEIAEFRALLAKVEGK